jgi:DNA-binding IclR family transcriptional regulator
VQPTPTEDARHSLLARVDVVLGSFDADHPALTLAGIVCRAGLPKTTVLRIVSQLVELGWVERSGDRYVVGTRVFELAGPAAVRTRLREPALPFMQDLYEATHETVHLAVHDGGSVLYIEKITGHRSVASPSRVGGRMPMHCTALGKVLLGYTPGALERVVAEGLRPRTPATIVSARRLRGEVAQVRMEGVGYDREETCPGLSCVAAPIFASDGSCVAAMSVTGPLNRLPLDRLSRLVRAASTGASRAMQAGAAWQTHR